ncbi:hypothetical protein F5Y13DRAFT_97094 [Hypoxylon sp. FL1857]|nr:hypothetical protein F5Y13DRAFT_97094 [Hypoxylon sp. FL1857]
MGDHSSRDHRRESDRRREYNRREDSRREGSRHESSRHESSRRESSRREQYRGEHATGRPVRQATVQVYSRVQGGRGGGSDTAGPSNRGPVVSSFVWQDSSSSGYSRHGQQFPLGPAPRDHALDDRINQWMQRLDINDSNTYTAPAAPITSPPPRLSK